MLGGREPMSHSRQDLVPLMGRRRKAVAVPALRLITGGVYLITYIFQELFVSKHV